MKRGKAADIDGLTVEHLQHSHPVFSVLLSKFFKLIVSSHYLPASFKCSYIVLYHYQKSRTVEPKLCVVMTSEELQSALYCLKYLNIVFYSNFSSLLSREAAVSISVLLIFPKHLIKLTMCSSY